MPRSRALSQCLDIQNRAYETAMAFKSLPSTEEAVERHARRCLTSAQVARAWESDGVHSRTMANQRPEGEPRIEYREEVAGAEGHHCLRPGGACSAVPPLAPTRPGGRVVFHSRRVSSTISSNF